MSDEEEVDLSDLGYAQVAGYFADKALAIEDEFPDLLEPLLFAAKAMMALARLNKLKSSGIHRHMEQWRRNCTWMVYCKGRLTEQVAKLDADHQDMKSDLHKEVVKSLVQQGMRSSNEKISAQMRQNREFRKLDRQLSELRAILTHVLDHCDQFKLIKDVLVQESTLTKHMMAS